MIYQPNRRAAAFWIATCMWLPGAASAQSCYDSAIVNPSPFLGNDGEIFKLTDGSIWEVKHEYLYMYQYSPAVIVCPAKGKLIVGGKQLNVQLLSKARPQQVRQASAAQKETPPASAQATGAPDFIESQIDGDFSGWDGETIFKLTNGQIWQQTTYAYTYSYSFMPKVMIFRVAGTYQLKVEGVDGRIAVTRLN